MDDPAPQKKPWWQALPVMLSALGACAVALTTIFGAVTPLVGWVGDYFQPKGCAHRSGYPVGKWNVEEIKSSTSRGEFSNFITFTNPKGGTWIHPQGQGNFTASNSPGPNAEVILTVKPDINPGNYVSTNKLVVSADGCRMEGTFADSQNHSGEVVYIFADQKPARK